MRQGGVTVQNFGDFWAVAGKLAYCGYDVLETLVDPDRFPLMGYDAQAANLLWEKRTPAAWTIGQEDAKDLGAIQQFFSGKRDELDPGIPFEEVGKIAAAREWLGAKLGIENPHAFSLDELAQKTAARLELSQAVVAGAFDDLFKTAAMPPRRIAIAVVPVPSLRAPESLPPEHQDTMALQLQLQAPAAQEPAFRPKLPAQRTKRWRTGEIEPNRPVSEVIRSHRRPAKHPGMVRRAAAVAAMAMAGLFLYPVTQADTPPPAPVVRLDPTPPRVLTPLVEYPLPVAERPPADHLIPLGNYDPVAGSGAIWFSVQAYAAQLGHPNLTPSQTYILTDKCIQYMANRLSGGMSWDQALHLPPSAQLPYPPAEVMAAWIASILSETSTTTV